MLQIEQLSVNYGESRVIHDVSLTAPEGEVVCLMGRNGMGKTTLLKAAMGVLKPRQGKILFNGEDVTNRSPAYRACAGIGYVPQGRGIFPYLTVYENLLMGLESSKNGKEDASGLQPMYEQFPVIHEMRDRAAGTLSGGQQQQLAIARALVRRPRLLILDEPTEGIQPSIMHEIEGVILSLGRSGMSILLVEQFLDFALRVADRYYVMETGSIVADGPIANFDHAVVSQYLSV